MTRSATGPSLAAAADSPALLNTFAQLIPGYVVGGYYIPPQGAASAAIQAEGTVTAVAFDVGEELAIDRIGINVTIVGTAGAVNRLGIYDTGTDGRPNALVVDGGTVDVTQLAGREATIATTLSAGTRYWLCSVPQGGAGTRATISVGTGALPLVNIGALSVLAFPARGYTMTGITGALPATFTVAAVAATSPAIAVRAA